MISSRPAKKILKTLRRLKVFFKCLLKPTSGTRRPSSNRRRCRRSSGQSELISRPLLSSCSFQHSNDFGNYVEKITNQTAVKIGFTGAVVGIVWTSTKWDAVCYGDDNVHTDTLVHTHTHTHTYTHTRGRGDGNDDDCFVCFVAAFLCWTGSDTASVDYVRSCQVPIDRRWLRYVLPRDSRPLRLLRLLR